MHCICQYASRQASKANNALMKDLLISCTRNPLTRNKQMDKQLENNHVSTVMEIKEDCYSFAASKQYKQ